MGNEAILLMPSDILREIALDLSDEDASQFVKEVYRAKKAVYLADVVEDRNALVHFYQTVFNAAFFERRFKRDFPTAHRMIALGAPKLPNNKEVNDPTYKKEYEDLKKYWIDQYKQLYDTAYCEFKNEKQRILKLFNYVALGYVDRIKKGFNKKRFFDKDLLVEDDEVKINCQIIKKKHSLIEFAIKKGNQEILDFFYPMISTKFIQKVALSQEFFWALHLNQLKTIKEWLKKEEDMECQYYNQSIKITNIPLQIACQNGYLELARLLIDHGSAINVKEMLFKVKETPLYAASKEGHFNIVKLLVESGADVNAKDLEQRTPLHLAAERGFLEIVKILYDKNPSNIHQKMIGEHTPLMRAALFGYAEVANFLSQMLVKNHSDNIKGDTSIHYLCMTENLTGVKILINGGVDVNTVDSSGNTPLHVACEHGHAKLVDFLIKENANINAENNHKETPLYFACENKDWEIAKVLIDKKERIDEEEKKAFHLLCKSQELETLKLFVQKIKEKERLNQKNIKGETALHLLCWSHDFDMLKFLLDSGASPHEKTNQGDTPLHYAYDDLAIVKLLLGSNVNINAIGNSNKTPLHLVCEGKVKEWPQIAACLVEAGANIFMKDHLGKTPLDYIPEHQKINAISLRKKSDQYQKIKPFLERARNADLQTQVEFVQELLNFYLQKGFSWHHYQSEVRELLNLMNDKLDMTMTEIREALGETIKKIKKSGVLVSDLEEGTFYRLYEFIKDEERFEREFKIIKPKTEKDIAISFLRSYANTGFFQWRHYRPEAEMLIKNIKEQPDPKKVFGMIEQAEAALPADAEGGFKQTLQGIKFKLSAPSLYLK